MKSLPNILSIFRICLVPVFVAAFILDDNDIRYWAISVFVIANLSDILDGYIARKYNALSPLGKILDPLGDKLITFAALICIATSRPVITWAVCVFFIKEALMGIGGLLIRKRAKVELPGANWLGKTATVTFFLVCAALLIFNETNIPDFAAVIMASAAIILMLAAFARYLYTFITIMKSRPQAETPANNEVPPASGNID